MFAFSVLILHYTHRAQDEKKVVGIMPFVSSQPQNRGTASQVQEMVVRLLSSNSNIQAVDRSKDSLVVRELDNQIRDVSVMAKQLADQGKLIGAKEIIVGTLSKASAEPVSGNAYGSNVKYSGLVNFSLQLIDVETGTVKEQETFEGSTNKVEAANKGTKALGSILKKSNPLGNNTTADILLADTKEKAILNAVNQSEKSIAQWVTKIYSSNIRILSVEERDKGLPEKVLVSGLGESVKKGTQITINEISFFDVDGKKMKREKKVGELKVEEVQGELTVCKVTNGEALLDEKLKANSKLELVIK